ncbi:E3 SUMO-protein ligase gei-17 [Paramyrothecium foliicola]|nr:E3 SUMO-protein ligase gei-17 [Paramyrothecium foliicola]
MPPSVDRSRPSGGDSERTQVATSNQTLNKFLGGHRPSWMTSRNAAIKPTVSTTPRTLPSKAPATGSHERQRKDFSVQVPPPKPTNISTTSLAAGLPTPNDTHVEDDRQRRNEHMAKEHIQWFAQFPGNSEALAREIPPFTHACSQIVAFLKNFAEAWHSLSVAVCARRYPVLAWEAVQILNCPSPILQSIFFTFSRRALWVQDGEFAVELNQLFARDQKQELQMAQDNAPSDIRARVRDDMVVRYATLVARAQRFQGNMPSEPSTAPPPVHPSQEVMVPNASATSDAGVRAPNKGMVGYMAVEVVKTADHDSIIALVKGSQHFSADQMRSEIRKRLQTSDEDIIVEDDFLTVSLADPFRSVMFDVPVRGNDCRHLECFDLETWLQTRPTKPARQGQGQEPCMVDVWKCPICGLDARPSSLRVDDYFTDVRTVLLYKGLERTKRIQIDAEGNWTPIVEAEDSDDEDLDTKDVKRQAPNCPSIKKTSTEVIEILDD